MPPPVKVDQEVLTSPPPEALEDGALNILDRYNNYRGYIAADGTCYNNKQEVIGYISVRESGEGQAGDAEERYFLLLHFSYRQVSSFLFSSNSPIHSP